MRTDLINIIFGMKVRQARTEMGLSLKDFAAQCEMSASYITEIEKGRKYPKIDKIMKMSTVLDKEYDELVSIRLDPSLRHLETTLSAPLLQAFPFDEFGLDIADLVNMLTRAPDKASALLRAILEIGRRYDMKDEHFLRAALRSYQEINDNYFPDLEEAALAFSAENALTVPVTHDEIAAVLQHELGYELDTNTLAGDPVLSGYRSVMVKGRPPRILVNSQLSEAQIKFLYAREIGYDCLKLKGRAFTSPPEVVESFEQVFNDFQASYFAGALLMPRAEILADIEAFFGQEQFQPQRLQAMLTKYRVTPEMLLYRFSELVPQHFGIGIHFLRFHDADGDYHLVKQLNMSQLPLPSGIGLNEHYCRRWLTTRLLQEMEDATPVSADMVTSNGIYARANGTREVETPHIGVQMSEYFGSGTRFLCMGFGRKFTLTPDVNTSVIVGFRVDSDLPAAIHFVDDPDVPVTVINETCERCPLTETQCTMRAAPPRVLRARDARAERQQAVQALLAELRN